LLDPRDVRLVNDYSDAVGDVEMFINGSWIPLCNHSITPDKAKLICKQLGWYSGDILAS